ncbi:hypothetical protein OC713_02630, partial [Sweet potato little leaf phytoplasma]
MKYKHKSESNQPEEGSNANVTEGYDSAEVLTVSTYPLEFEWILDIGCLFHMTPNRHWFQEFQSITEGKILLGNHQECSVKGIRTVQVKMFDNQIRVMSNVRYVPELKRSLLSLGGFDKAVYVCKLENGTLYEIQVRELKKGAGREEITREIPNVSAEAIKNLDSRGIIIPGS